MLLWCKSYIECCKELHEWTMVSESAQQMNQPDAQCEVLWRNGEWAALKDRITPVSGQPLVGLSSFKQGAFPCGTHHTEVL